MDVSKLEEIYYSIVKSDEFVDSSKALINVVKKLVRHYSVDSTGVKFLVGRILRTLEWDFLFEVEMDVLLRRSSEVKEDET